MTTTQINTAELSGAALCWAVAEAQKLKVYIAQKHVWLDREANGLSDNEGSTYLPVINWAQGGPILNEMILSGNWEVVPWGIKDRAACVQNWNNECIPIGNMDWDSPNICEVSENILEAACRAKVIWELGPTVSVPTELVEGGV